jgi:hypothetical protein
MEPRGWPLAKVSLDESVVAVSTIDIFGSIQVAGPFKLNVSNPSARNQQDTNSTYAKLPVHISTEGLCFYLRPTRGRWHFDYAEAPFALRTGLAGQRQCLPFGEDRLGFLVRQLRIEFNLKSLEFF